MRNSTLPILPVSPRLVSHQGEDHYTITYIIWKQEILFIKLFFKEKKCKLYIIRPLLENNIAKKKTGHCFTTPTGTE